MADIKLIGVGMRYMTSEANRVLKSAPMATTVELIPEPNPNGVKYQGTPMAVGIYLNRQKVAYVRNSDLEEYFRNFGATACKAGKIRERRENYIVVTAESSRAMSDHTLDAARYNTVTDPKTFATKVDGDIKQKESNTMNFNVRDQFFREVKNVAIDVQSGKFGVVTADGIAVYDKGSINVNPIQELGVKIPAFALRIAVDALKEGDLILGEGDPVFFVKKTETGFETISTKGIRGEVGNVKNMFFGENTVLAVKNMFEGSGMNPMVMLMMAGEGKNGIDMKTIALMSMMNGGKGGFDPSMLMMLALAGK